jgi:hypothetical protein
MKHLGILLILLQFPLAPAWTAALADSPAKADSSAAADSSCNCDENDLNFFSSPLEQEPSPVERELRERLPQSDSGLRLDLFVMSLCPYGMEAERALLPLAARFADQLELELHYIADEAAADSTGAAHPSPAPAIEKTRESARRPGCANRNTAPGDGPFRSLHGREEIDESRRQLLLKADYPDRHLPYILCRSRQGAGGDWQRCARAVGLDPDSLQTLAMSRRGERLFRDNIRLANDLQIDLSPTLLIDGEEFTGDLYGFSLTRSICRRLPDDARCREIPVCGADADCQADPGQLALCEHPDSPQARCVRYEPVPFTLTVLNSATCPACSTDSFLRTTLELFPGARVQNHILESPQGAGLAQKYGIRVFPAYIFSAKFATSPRFPRVRSMVAPVDSSYLVQARIAGISYWSERTPQPDGLDLFLPAWDLEMEREFLPLWSAERRPGRIHYLLGPLLASEHADWSDVPEEFDRRACLATEQTDRYPAFVTTLGATRPGTPNWKEVARTAGVDLPALEQCVASGRGRQLLRTAQVLADSLDLNPGTPSALLDNRILVRRARASQVAAIRLEGKNP